MIQIFKPTTSTSTSFNPSPIFKPITTTSTSFNPSPITTIWSSTFVSPWGTQVEAPQALILHCWPPQPQTAVGPFWVCFMVFKSKHHTTLAEGLDRSRERERAESLCEKRDWDKKRWNLKTMAMKVMIGSWSEERGVLRKPWVLIWDREKERGFKFGLCLNQVR